MAEPSQALAQEPASRRTEPTVRYDRSHRPCLKILLVEDNTDSLRYLGITLRRRGHEVAEANCLEVARQAVADTKFDLLISDIELPDGSGLELMRELRPRGVRGIALSGHGSEDDLRESLAAGFAMHPSPSRCFRGRPRRGDPANGGRPPARGPGFRRSPGSSSPGDSWELAERLVDGFLRLLVGITVYGGKSTASGILPPLWGTVPADAQVALLDAWKSLQERIADLEATVRDLQARLQLNSTNSSKPPSSDPIGLEVQAADPAVPTEATGSASGKIQQLAGDSAGAVDLHRDDLQVGAAVGRGAPGALQRVGRLITAITPHEWLS